jgi:hypothetical protein
MLSHIVVSWLYCTNAMFNTNASASAGSLTAYQSDAASVSRSA